MNTERKQITLLKDQVRDERVSFAGHANQHKILFFNSLGSFMRLISNIRLMQMGNYFMGQANK